MRGLKWIMKRENSLVSYLFVDSFSFAFPSFLSSFISFSLSLVRSFSLSQNTLSTPTNPPPSCSSLLLPSWTRKWDTVESSGTAGSTTDENGAASIPSFLPLAKQSPAKFDSLVRRHTNTQPRSAVRKPFANRPKDHLQHSRLKNFGDHRWSWSHLSFGSVHLVNIFFI